MSQVLKDKLAAVRRKQALVAAGSGLAAMAGLAVLLLAAGMILDLMLELPRSVRAALLAIDLAVLGYVALTRVLAPVVFAPDDQAVALQVEHAIPDFRTRLIASIQLAHPQAVPAGTSHALVRAMIRQTESFAAPIDFTAIVRTDPLVRVAALSAFILLLGLSSFLYSAQATTDLLRRAFLANIPVPRSTRVICLSGDKIIAVGDSIALEARAQGVIPASGTIRVDYASGRQQNFSINPKPEDPARFAQTIENVQESFTYSIHLNDGRSDLFSVQAVSRPVVTSLTMEQVYPAYTGRQPERRSPGDLLLLAGSELKVNLTANKPIKQGLLRLVGLKQDLPIAATAKDRTALSGLIARIPPRGLSGFSIQLIDDNGIASSDDTVYPIDVLIDKEPTVRITWPDRKEELATQMARLLLSFEASDDFGIKRVLLHYHVDKPISADALLAGPERIIELDLTGTQDTRRIHRRYEFDLGKLNPVPLEGCAVEYWLEVQDANNITGPGQAFSDRFRARIVSEIAKRADLMNRLNDQLGTIDAVTTDEEKLNQTLGELIFEKPRQ